MVNLKKIERIKKKRDSGRRMLGERDIKGVREMFVCPGEVIKSDIQLLLVPFISYNLSYPFDSMKFSLLSQPVPSGFVFQFVGKNAKVPIYFENTTRLVNRTDLKQWISKKEQTLRKEFRKAYSTVYNDLDNDPASLWYNNIKNIQIPVGVLENISSHFTHQIVIITYDSLTKHGIRNGKVPGSLIELPNSTATATLAKPSPVYG